MLHQLLLVFHVLLAIALIALVLIQQGKGAELGASFGSGASQTLFGSQGSGSFLLKVTGLLAFLFFGTSLALGYIASHQTKQDLIQNLAKIATQLPPVKQPTVQQPVVPNAGVPLPANPSATAEKPVPKK